MKLFGKDGVTRRRFLIGGAAATAATAAAVSLAGCNGNNEDDNTGEPQVIDDDSQIVDALDEYASADAAATLNATWTLPLGTLLYHTDGVWSAAMMAPESATSINTLGVLSLTSGSLITLVASPVRGRTYDFHDVRCGNGVFAWLEVEYSTLTWVLLASSFADGTLMSDPVELDSGGADWDPPLFTAVGSTVFWQKMPSLSGDRTAEASRCYAWAVGDNDPREVWESPGRFATQPRVSDGILTITPRVRADEGTYYGMTALNVGDGTYKQVDQLVLPAGVRPFDAVYMNSSFAFSIEASYSGSGSLGNMGTFIGREGGPYVYISREPAACPAGKGTRYIVKIRSSHYVIDTDAQTYGMIACPDRSLDYGDYPASEGTCDLFMVYATVKNDQGMPDSVTARVFAL